MLNTHDIEHPAVETIYLVPDSSEGQRCYLWCDDPAPGLDTDPSEAVEYLRKDVHDAIVTKLEAHVAALKDDRDAYRTAEEHQIALRQKTEQERDALAALVDRLNIAFCDHISSDCLPLLEDAVQAAPLESLGRRDLIKQAEVLEALSAHVKTWTPSQLFSEAIKLRQQAEAIDLNENT